jgi:hypothetical protein
MKKCGVLETGKKSAELGFNQYVSVILPKDWLFYASGWWQK